ncbi:MAG TPA: sulfotransferase [Candidatus Limnocylindrales bacterium]|jgi:hypothetical protein
MTGPTDERRLPDFLIVGAPRCGTTFMYEYLDQHPGVFMSPVKEPNHFATDLDSGSYLDAISFMRDRQRYRALFADARPDQLTGEASTWHLYSQAAASNIKAANPDARIIIMLRDPIEMMFSLHERRLYGGSEHLRRFEDALAAEDDRRAGRQIAPQARNVKGLLYREVARYASQVERYLDQFGPGRVHVIIFDDFRADPARAYRATLEFLGLDATFEPRFEVVNPALERRNLRLHQLAMTSPVQRAARSVLRGPLGGLVGDAWSRLNTRGKRRLPPDPELVAGLREELRPDVERLSAMLGRDLSALWWPAAGSGAR